MSIWYEPDGTVRSSQGTVLDENARLRKEIATLKAWKAEALIALAERDEHRETLQQLLPAKYVGWHYLESAVDYIRALKADAAQVRSRVLEEAAEAVAATVCPVDERDICARCSIKAIRALAVQDGA